MSPEQTALAGVDVDTRSDIYSLGVLLYELLTSTTPCSPDTLRDAGFDEIRRLIREVDPPRPSARLSALGEPLATISINRCTHPGRLHLAVRGELDWIVMKALEKDRRRRYETAGDLAADIQCHLADRPVAACPPSLWYRASKFARRHVGWFAASLLVGVSLIAGMAATVAQMHRAQNAEKRANDALKQTEEQRRLVVRHLADARLRLADEWIRSGHVGQAQEVLEQARADGQSGSFAWRYLSTMGRREVEVYPNLGADVRAFGVASDGRRMAYGNQAGQLAFWDLAEDRRLRTVDASRDPINRVVMSPDGSLAVTVSGGGLQLWDAETGQPRGTVTVGGPDPMPRPVFLEDRRHLLVLAWRLGDPQGTATLVRLESDGGELPVVHRWTFHGEAAESPGAGFLILRPEEGLVSRIALPSGKTAWSRPSESSPPRRTWVSPDGSHFACAWQNHVTVHDARDGRELRRWSVSYEPTNVWLGPGARDVVVGLGNEGVRIHALEGEAPPRRFDLWDVDTPALGHDYAASISPDGKRLAIAGWRNPGGGSPLTLRDMATGSVLATCPHELRQASKLTFAEDGRSILAVGRTELIRWVLPGGPDRGGPLRLTGHQDEAWSLAFAATGTRLFTGSDDSDEPQTLKVWDPESGRLVLGWKPQPGTVSTLATSADGRWLVTGSLSSSQNLRLWDARPVSAGSPAILEAELEAPSGFVRAVAFGPDGRLLAAAGNDGQVRIWEVPSRRPRLILKGHRRKVRDLAFSPDGQHLASVADDSQIRIWKMRDGSIEKTLTRATELVAVAFTPDGKTLASAQQGGLVTLWDVATGELERTLPVDDRELRCMAMTPDGQSLAVSGSSGRVHVFDLVTAQRVLVLDGHAAPVNRIQFSADGTTLASCSHDGAVILWRARHP
jgi:WD40 repeat protein